MLIKYIVWRIMVRLIKICNVFAFCLLYMYSWASGQGSTSSCDCFGAVEVLDTLPKKIFIDKGKGIINDFIHYPSSFPIKDENIVWLEVEVPFDSYFAFDIIADEQVKFMLFHSNRLDFCKDLEFKYIRPDVLSIHSHEGKTGLNREPAKGYQQAIEVKKNDLVFIAVNTDQPKVEIEFKPHFFPQKGTEIPVAEHKEYNMMRDPTKKNVFFELLDSESGAPVYANVTFNGNRLDNYAFSGSLFKFDIERTGTVEMNIIAKGYFFKNEKFELKSSKNLHFKIPMVRLAEGKKLNLPDVKFKMGTDEFLPTAYTTLKRLFDFLKLNRNIRVEIQGHVNGPGMENNAAMQRLSEKRAKAVMHYLIENGIDKDRLEHKGFGNTQMVIEEPKDFEEEEKNRRVEIKIIE